MCLAYILVAVLVVIAIYLLYTQWKQHDENTTIEGFYPRRWWYGPNWRWGWRRNWLSPYGNWRPYGYYPAYSGYWKQCEPAGTWCPADMTCNSPACQ